jgi:hypothetical protein
LNPEPLFTQPLAIRGPEETLEETLEKSTKAKGAQKLLHGVRKVVARNIEDRMTSLLEFWDLTNKSSVLNGIILSLKELFK